MNASQRNLFTYIYLSKLVHLYLIHVFDQFWNIVNLNKTKQKKKKRGHVKQLLRALDKREYLVINRDNFC